jgi:hypothetical protein
MGTPRPDAGHDGGPIVVLDMAAPLDLGADFGRDSGGSGGSDLGGCVPTPLSYQARQCSPAVTSCLRSCSPGDDTCVSICIELEDDCSLCVTVNSIKCAVDSGCMRQWNAFDCCFQANCARSSDPMCADRFCGAESSAYRECARYVYATEPPCATRVEDCFTL